ncbi:hypothetical protein JD969_10000 [Planctomycetota bacterium]|nr:hypothetical protein JD969_10000 [Planctomycetota bacterium]
MDKPKLHQNSLKPPAYCMHCEYNIAYLTDHRCPECGRSFDPSDPTTYFGPYQERTKPPYTTFFISICIVSTICVFFPILNILWFLITCIVTYIIWKDKDEPYRVTACFTLFYVIVMNMLSFLA